MLFKCKHCANSFNLKGTLTKHMKSVHPDLVPKLNDYYTTEIHTSIEPRVNGNDGGPDEAGEEGGNAWRGPENKENDNPEGSPECHSTPNKKVKVEKAKPDPTKV